MKSDVNRVRPLQAVTSCLVFVAAPLALLAAQSDAPSLADCQSIQDATSRLACYDRVASPASPAAEKAVTPAADEPAAVPTPPPEEALLPAAATTAVPPPADEAIMPAADEQPAVMSAPPEDPEELSDEIGSETVKGRQTEDRDLSVRGSLVRCERGRSSKLVFYFENGQIWRQKDNKRLSWNDCAFDVTISKDFFGYKMVRDNDDSMVRIERVE